MINTIHQPHDKFFKQAMSELAVAKDFFQTYLPSELLNLANLNTLKLEKETFIEDNFKAFAADLVYSVRLAKQTAFFYLLCEHQDKVDEYMAFRLLTYIVRLLDLYSKQHPGEPLPLVYPLVLYTGEKKWDASCSLFDLFKQPDLASKMFLQPFNLIDVHRVNDENLRSHLLSGLLQFVLKYRKLQDISTLFDELFVWLNEVEEKVGSCYPKTVLQYLIYQLDGKNVKKLSKKADEYLSSNLRGEIMTFAQRFEQQGFKKGIKQGIKEGIKEGMQQAIRHEREMLLLLLKQKFQIISDHYNNLIESTFDSQLLLQWAKNAITAHSLEEVFASKEDEELLAS